MLTIRKVQVLYRLCDKKKYKTTKEKEKKKKAKEDTE